MSSRCNPEQRGGRTTRSDEGDELTGLDLEGEAAQHGDVRSRAVAEVDVLELEVALAVRRLLAVRRVDADFGLRGCQSPRRAAEGSRTLASRSLKMLLAAKTHLLASGT